VTLIGTAVTAVAERLLIVEQRVASSCACRAAAWSRFLAVLALWLAAANASAWSQASASAVAIAALLATLAIAATIWRSPRRVSCSAFS